MRPTTRLAVFAVALLAAFGLGAGAGALLGDDAPAAPTPSTPEHQGHGS